MAFQLPYSVSPYESEEEEDAWLYEEKDVWLYEEEMDVWLYEEEKDVWLYEEEKDVWLYESEVEEFETGDILRFGIVPPLHYAVYIGNGEIVHYNKINRKIRVIRETLEGYKSRKSVADSAVKKVTYDLSGPSYSPSEIRRRALLYVNKKNYNLLIRNCEHFATWCVYGKGVSGQARALVMGGGTAVTTATGTGLGALIGGGVGSVVPIAGTIVGATVGGVIGTGVGLAVGGFGSAVGWVVNAMDDKEEEEF